MQEQMIFNMIKDKIKNIDEKEEIKERLYNVNQMIMKFKKYNQKLPHIIVDNFETNDLESISNKIVDIVLNYYDEYDGNVIKYSDYPLLDNKSISGSLLIVDDFFDFYDDLESKFKAARKVLSQVRNDNILLIITCKDDIEKYFNNDFNEKTFHLTNSIRIHYNDLLNDEIIKMIVNNFEKKNILFKYDIDTITKVIEDSKNNYGCTNSNCAEYISNEIIKDMIINNKEIADLECLINKTDVDENKVDVIDNLIGLDNIKNQIDTLKNYLDFKNKIKIKDDNFYLNMFFLGNPGTGKTTVARYLTKILYDLGYIKENKLIEIVPNDLMANYVGQTKDKTRSILKKAKDGVLFIDEAYGLGNVKYTDGFASYMKEAIVELLKYLEDPKNVVIFAGYPKEMKKIYDSNPGIKSRIFKEIYFDDYNECDLLEITKKNLKDIGMKLNKNAEKLVLDIIRSDMKENDFGNARYCEKLAQALVFRHANRKLKNENFTITLEDILIEKDKDINEKKYTFGFIGD